MSPRGGTPHHSQGPPAGGQPHPGGGAGGQPHPGGGYGGDNHAGGQGYGGGQGGGFGQSFGQGLGSGLGGSIGQNLGDRMFGNNGYGQGGYGAGGYGQQPAQQNGGGYGDSGQGGYGGGGYGDPGQGAGGGYSDSGQGGNAGSGQSAGSGSGYEIAGQLAGVNSAVAGGDWVDPQLGVMDNGIAALGSVANPLDALDGLQVPGLPQMLQPMHEAMSWFAGDPSAVAQYVELWRQVAKLARDSCDQLHGTLTAHLGDWQGAAADNYRTQAQGQHGDLSGLAEAAECIATIVESAGKLAGSARAQIQQAAAGCVNDIVNRIPAWNANLVADPTGGMNAVMADASGIVANWA
ncbi:hypothetical protein F0L68_24370 [Solihabitans fulvus]|uniref:PPE family protein n=1 Tax=Solihabitans fulvus TaxID=1892852 RepID=A0A5B2X4F5_9PSEU|nr:hypothetical protein [Solihabitans fulvus]KAA2258114.1 hypothetical protein F0L68_24370 [Solihabitans fulvus]